MNKKRWIGTLVCALLLAWSSSTVEAAGVKGAPTMQGRNNVATVTQVRSENSKKTVKRADRKEKRTRVKSVAKENTVTRTKKTQARTDMPSVKSVSASTEGTTVQAMSVAGEEFVAANGPPIAVGIARGCSVATVGAQGEFTVFDGVKKWKSFPAGTSVRVTRIGDVLHVNGTPVGKTVYVRGRGDDVVTYDETPYRGILRLIPTVGAGGVTVVNEVSLESYLCGVVPKEVSPSWERNALRAQAVAARSYALAHRGTYGAQGFDVVDTIASQVYGGLSAETERTTRAVRDTRGEVLVYDGRPIDAMFFAHGGGYTEDSENIWGNAIPYLRAVQEPLNSYTKQPWKVTVSLRRLAAELTARGYDVGDIRKIQLSKLTKAPMKKADRGVSGRVKMIVIEGKKGKKIVSGNLFQQMFDLRSTMFDIQVGKGGTIDIIGYGYGHGLGLSQWGAQIMAQNRDDDPLYYRAILAHFYRNTELTNWY